MNLTVRNVEYLPSAALAQIKTSQFIYSIAKTLK